MMFLQSLLFRIVGINKKELLMKKYLYSILVVSTLIILNACSDDDKKAGNPTIDIKSKYGNAMFGDSLPFSVDVADKDVALSTVKVQLYFDEEKVSETVVRTKTEGNYEGKIFVPFLKDIPNGTATLKFVLQNINFTITEEAYDLPLTRPDFPSLTLVAEDGKEYKMARTAANTYTATEDFPKSKVKAYIKAPVVGEFGNEITFGWESNAITQSSVSKIPFSNLAAGKFDITFNTLTYDAAPFIVGYFINGKVLTRLDDNQYFGDYDLKQGDAISVGGIDDFEGWWIDPTFVDKKENGALTFAPTAGKYRVTANFQYSYLQFEPLGADGKLATLQADGTGALWVIGEGVGKPSVASNQVGWNTDKGLAMAAIGGKKYQMTFVGGQSLKLDDINFKFFHQKGWGGEFKVMTTDSDLVFVGAGEDPGPGDKVRDPGNLGLLKGKKFEEGATYVFTVDLSKGLDKASLTVVKK